MECENSFSYGVCNTSLSAWNGDKQSNGTAYKRKRYENGYFTDSNGCKESLKGPTKLRATCFVQMLPNKGVFQSEKWKPNGSTLYYPVTSHLLVNFEKYDQISFDEGLFFIGDDSGGCVQKEQGYLCRRAMAEYVLKSLAISYPETDVIRSWNAGSPMPVYETFSIPTPDGTSLGLQDCPGHLHTAHRDIAHLHRLPDPSLLLFSHCLGPCCSPLSDEENSDGHVINCWRFDDKEKTLFIAMSYLFTHLSTFQEVVSQLN